MRDGTTYHIQDRELFNFKEVLASVTRKGQITLPVEIRRSLGIKQGDKVAVSLAAVSEGEAPRVILKPVSSVAEMTHGAVPPLKEPLTWQQMREIAREDQVQELNREDL